MLKLYCAPRTRSIRIAWLLEEINVTYEIEHATFSQTKSEFFIQKTPTGKYPTIDDDGFIMMESGAIIEYLLEKHPNNTLMPHAGTIQKAKCLQWMHFADATAFSPLGIVIWLSVYRDDVAEHPQLIEDARARALSAFEIIDTEIQGQDWLLGDQFSAADIMMGFTLMAASVPGLLETKPSLSKYLSRLQNRPAFQVALKKTGGF